MHRLTTSGCPTPPTPAHRRGDAVTFLDALGDPVVALFRPIKKGDERSRVNDGGGHRGRSLRDACESKRKLRIDCSARTLIRSARLDTGLSCGSLQDEPQSLFGQIPEFAATQRRFSLGSTVQTSGTSTVVFIRNSGSRKPQNNIYGDGCENSKRSARTAHACWSSFYAEPSAATGVQKSIRAPHSRRVFFRFFRRAGGRCSRARRNQ